MAEIPSYWDLQQKVRKLEAEAARFKQIQKELNESERRFRDVAANALEWIWEIDARGRYTYSSPVIKQILGYDPEEVIGKYYYNFFHPECKNELKNAALITFSQKKPFRKFINRNITKSGDTVILSTSGVPIINNDNTLVGYRGSDADITDEQETFRKLKERESELENKTRDLRQANAALNVLLDKRESDKLTYQDSVAANINQLIIPYLQQIKKHNLAKDQQVLFDIVKSNLNEITESFSYRLSSRHIGLTPAELKVADLVRQGQTSKMIAHLLCLSVKTVETHRENIRKKLGIINQKINLQSYLLSLK